MGGIALTAAHLSCEWVSITQTLLTGRGRAGINAREAHLIMPTTWICRLSALWPWTRYSTSVPQIFHLQNQSNVKQYLLYRVIKGSKWKNPCKDLLAALALLSHSVLAIIYSVDTVLGPWSTQSRPSPCQAPKTSLLSVGEVRSWVNYIYH